MITCADHYHCYHCYNIQVDKQKGCEREIVT